MTVTTIRRQRWWWWWGWWWWWPLSYTGHGAGRTADMGQAWWIMEIDVNLFFVNNSCSTCRGPLWPGWCPCTSCWSMSAAPWMSVLIMHNFSQLWFHQTLFNRKIIRGCIKDWRPVKADPCVAIDTPQPGHQLPGFSKATNQLIIDYLNHPLSIIWIIN